MRTDVAFRGRPIIVTMADGKVREYRNKSAMLKELGIPFAEVDRLLRTGETYRSMYRRRRHLNGLTIDYKLTEEDIYGQD